MKFLNALLRALTYGLIMAAYIQYFNLPPWPALGLIFLSDVLAVVVKLAFPRLKANPEK